MLLRMSRSFRIDNPRGYPPQPIEELPDLLIQGVPAHPDPKRRNFYDIALDNRGFFVHVLGSESVILLAMWQKRAVSLSAA